MSRLKDLQYLHLACQIEEAFERLERGFAKHLPPHVRQQLDPLFQEGPNHHRLSQAFADLNHQLAEHEGDIGMHDLLAAIRDCEQVARDFYRDNARNLSDPRLVRIFEGLAEEEGQHLEAAEKALKLSIP